MNQDNLNYIKKELKLKKNRSDIERPTPPILSQAEQYRPEAEQLSHQNKLYKKYRRDQQVSEKEPHLEDTQRRSDAERPLDLMLPQDIQEDYHSQSDFFKQNNNERQFITSSQGGAAFIRGGEERPESNLLKMYHSLPYEDPQKRISSIQGFFGENMSINLRPDNALFLESLQEYIIDLNQSKKIQSSPKRQQIYSEIQRTRFNSDMDRKKQSSMRNCNGHDPKETSQNQSNSRREQDLKQDTWKLDMHCKHDTFGAMNNSKMNNSKMNNSKMKIPIIHSKNESNLNQSRSSMSRTHNEIDFEQRLKEQRLNNILLAQQIERLRKLIDVKEQIIKKYETDNDLLNQELRHVKVQQNIINKRKSQQKEYQINYQQFTKPNNRMINDENMLKIGGDYSSIAIHHRHTSTNPNRATNRTQSSARPTDQFGELFEQFGAKQNFEANRQKRKRSQSLQRLEREYNDFLLQDKKSSRFQRTKR